jgi:prepilin-type N-terminal cleavage/methylation domain-containing protein
MRVATIGRRGATLVELIVALFIGSILVAMVTRFFGSQNKTYMSQIDSAELRGGIRASMDLLQRELRNAGFDPTGAGFHGVSFDSLRLILRSDFNGDGDLMDPDEEIAYLHDAKNRLLLRGPARKSTMKPQVVLEEVDTFEFVPLDAFGNKVKDSADCGAIREVMVKLVAYTAKTNGADAGKGGKQRNGMTVSVLPTNLDLPKMPPATSTSPTP